MTRPDPYLIYAPILNSPNHYLNQVLNELNSIRIKWHTYFISCMLQLEVNLRLIGDGIGTAIYTPHIDSTLATAGEEFTKPPVL